MHDIIVKQWDMVLKEEAVGQLCTNFHHLVPQARYKTNIQEMIYQEKSQYEKTF